LKIKVIEYSGEIDKVGEYLNYGLRLDLNSTGFIEQFFKKREQALLRRAETKKDCIEKLLNKGEKGAK